MHKKTKYLRVVEKQNLMFQYPCFWSLIFGFGKGKTPGWLGGNKRAIGTEFLISSDLLLVLSFVFFLKVFLYINSSFPWSLYMLEVEFVIYVYTWHTNQINYRTLLILWYLMLRWLESNILNVYVLITILNDQNRLLLLFWK